MLLSLSDVSYHKKKTTDKGDSMDTLEYNVVYHSDYLDFMRFLPDHSVELILTDPPYSRDSLPLFTGLAAEAKRVLRVGGSLVTMAPNFMLPEGLSHMTMFLKYRWTIHHDYWHGAHARMVMGIEVTWKPLVWLVNEKLSPNRFITDSMRAGKRDKTLHKWQQDMAWALYLIEQLTDEGDLVVDPFVGSGTVAEAAELLNRDWSACDIDEDAVNITKERMAAVREALEYADEVV